MSFFTLMVGMKGFLLWNMCTRRRKVWDETARDLLQTSRPGAAAQWYWFGVRVQSFERDDLEAPLTSWVERSWRHHHIHIFSPAPNKEKKGHRVNRYKWQLDVLFKCWVIVKDMAWNTFVRIHLCPSLVILFLLLSFVYLFIHPSICLSVLAI